MTTRYETSVSHRGPVSAVAVKDDIIYSGSYDGYLGCWTPGESGLVLQKLLYLHAKGINCVAGSPAGSPLATGGSDGAACIVLPGVDSASVLRCAHPGDVECVVFNGDGRLLFSGGTDGFGRVFEVATGVERHAIHHGATVGAACRHPDSDLLITASNDRRIRVVRWDDGSVVAVSEAHNGPVKALAVCALGILSTGHDQRVLLHNLDLTTPRELMRFSTTPKSMAAEPDGNAVWIGVYDQGLLRFTCTDNGLYRDVETRSPRFWAHGLAAAPGRAVIGAFDGAPIVWGRDAAGATVTCDVPDHPVPCISAAAGDKELILVGGDSGIIRSVSAPDFGDVTTAGSMEGAITSMSGTSGDLVVGTWDGVVARRADGREAWRALWPQSLGGVDRAPSPVLRVARHSGRVIAGLYTSGWVCFQESDGHPLWHATESTGAVKSVDLRGDVYAVTGRYDPLRVGDASTGMVRARLGLGTPVSDVVVISPFDSAAPTRIAVCAGANEIWIVDLIKKRDQWDLQVIQKSGGHRLPVKTLLWLEPDVVLAGDYAGAILEHRVGRPSRLVCTADCRLGISSLLSTSGGPVIYTTFDGGIGDVSNVSPQRRTRSAKRGLPW